MFAIDAVKLPSNASKEWSGTKADLKQIDAYVADNLFRKRDPRFKDGSARSTATSGATSMAVDWPPPNPYLVTSATLVWAYCVNAIGLPIVHAVTDRPWGLRDFVVGDPSGFEIRFAQVL